MPAQKASIAVPFSTLATIGKATLIEVASNAAIKVMTERELNATTNLQYGLKVFAGSWELLLDACDGGLDEESSMASLVSFGLRCASVGGLVAVISKWLVVDSS